MFLGAASPLVLGEALAPDCGDKGPQSSLFTNWGTRQKAQVQWRQTDIEVDLKKSFVQVRLNSVPQPLLLINMALLAGQKLTVFK